MKNYHIYHILSIYFFNYCFVTQPLCKHARKKQAAPLISCGPACLLYWIYDFILNSRKILPGTCINLNGISLIDKQRNHNLCSGLKNGRLGCACCGITLYPRF